MRMKLQCEHSDVERVLDRLHEEISRFGETYIHPSTVIYEKDFGLHVTADKPSAQDEVLFKLSGGNLLLVDNFHLTVEDDTLGLHGTDKDLSANQRRIGELIIELYNLTDKVKEYKRTSHYFALSPFPKVIQHLNQGRPKKIHPLWQQKKMGKLLLQGLLGRRVMVIPGKGSADPVRVIAPFIDCLNHHNKAPRFQIKTNGTENIAGQVLWTFNTQSMFGAEECAVCYTLLDPLDSLLNYGFVETSGTICKSVPLEITLANGLTLDLRSEFHLHQGVTPPILKDLYPFYIPQIWKANPQLNRVSISHLFIPGTASPDALTKVLSHLIEISCQGLPKNILQDLIVEAETAIISGNMDYYMTLQKLCGKVEEKTGNAENGYLNMVKEMARLQINWLNLYRNSECQSS